MAISAAQPPWPTPPRALIGVPMQLRWIRAPSIALAACLHPLQGGPPCKWRLQTLARRRFCSERVLGGKYAAPTRDGAGWHTRRPGLVLPALRPPAARRVQTPRACMLELGPRACALHKTPNMILCLECVKQQGQSWGLTDGRRGQRAGGWVARATYARTHCPWIREEHRSDPARAALRGAMQLCQTMRRPRSRSSRRGKGRLTIACNGCKWPLRRVGATACGCYAPHSCCQRFAVWEARVLVDLIDEAGQERCIARSGAQAAQRSARWRPSGRGTPRHLSHASLRNLDNRFPPS